MNDFYPKHFCLRKEGKNLKKLPKSAWVGVAPTRGNQLDLTKHKSANMKISTTQRGWVVVALAL